MAVPSPSIVRPAPGLKRDGTRFEGDNYIDGQWVRWQRGLPRKIWGFRSVSKYLTEVSRGITNFVQAGQVYVHSGGVSKLERFTLDSNLAASVITDRTPGAYATGTVTLTGGASGSVNSVTVDGVTITSGAVPFNVSLNQTATDLAADINAFVSTPEYTASAAGAVVTITATELSATPNGYVVATTLTTITATTANLSGGIDSVAPSADNMWMFDVMYDSSGSANSLIAHVSPNGSCVCNTAGGQIFYGDIAGTSRLVEITIPAGANATGGIVVLHPYLFYYGTAGIIGWSTAGDPTALSGTDIARVWGQKIIKGLPLRAGSGSAPAGIFWAYDAVIRATFTGGLTLFQFDVIATETSIMNQNVVVDYDGVFYWAGLDRFMQFNGVVREVPNQMNLNWFFDGLNTTQRSKVFAFKVPRFGEVWWCYPRGSATECTHVVIYNVRENTWYDTELPSAKRTAGTYCNGLTAPILPGYEVTPDGYQVWVHERGVDHIDGQNIYPIQSYYETCDISLVAQKGINNQVRVTLIEPDFVQAGDMLVTVTGRMNARAPEVTSTAWTFPAEPDPTLPYEQIVVLKEQRRELRLKFESNEVGGDYQAGQILAHLSSGDGSVLP